MGKRYDLAEVPGDLPSTMIDENIDLQQFQELAQQTLRDLESGTATLAATALWRDWLALTGQVTTKYSGEKVQAAWKESSPGLSSISFHPTVITKPTAFHSWVDVPFTFHSPHGNLVRACTGRMSFQALPNGGFEVWMIVTVMDNFVGHANPDTPPRARNGPANDQLNGTSDQAHSNGHVDVQTNDSYKYDAIVLGAGQCGLSAAGRLAAIGAKYALLERQAFVGRTWTKRYETVRQHTIREYNNLPFERTWDDSDPNLLPGKIVAEGFENYIKRYNINIRFNTDTRSATWNQEEREWTLDIISQGESYRIICKHLIVAIGGGSASNNLPHLDGVSDFQGTLLGSGDYKHSREWSGKHGVVVGSATMAHDIAHDMYKAGLRSVTMVQRGRTAIYPIEFVVKNQEKIYNTKIPTAIADALSASTPNKIVRQIAAVNFDAKGTPQQAKFEALESAGFRVDQETPMFDNILNRFGGYYIDVGASDLIARGDVKVKSGIPIKTLTCKGIEFEDGIQIPADVVVLATGQSRNYGGELAKFLGMDVLRNIGDFWGLDEEGEVRGVMKTTAPGLWLFAGNTIWARWWSRFIALGIQSDLLDEPLKCVRRSK